MTISKLVEQFKSGQREAVYRALYFDAGFHLNQRLVASLAEILGLPFVTGYNLWLAKLERGQIQLGIVLSDDADPVQWE